MRRGPDPHYAADPGLVVDRLQSSSGVVRVVLHLCRVESCFGPGRILADGGPLRSRWTGAPIAI